MQKFKLDIYINKIFDFKTDKDKALKKIISSNRINSFDLIYIGDNKTDKIASEKASCNFIYYKVGLLNNEEKFF